MQNSAGLTRGFVAGAASSLFLTFGFFAGVEPRKAALQEVEKNSVPILSITSTKVLNSSGDTVKTTTIDTTAYLIPAKELKRLKRSFDKKPS